MKLPRRRFLSLAVGAAALSTVSRVAIAQTYPARPVHIIAGYPPGGVVDIYARLTGQWLSGRLGQWRYRGQIYPGPSGALKQPTEVGMTCFGSHRTTCGK
jgi:tripartite-type tricarboxylate transporter receptor subunit TctC